MKKRGQVTTFIIIGIVLVVLFVLVYSIGEYVIKSDFEKALEKQASIPQKIKPISDYINSCVLDVARDGINILGQQGGYIDIPSEEMPRTLYTPFSTSLEIFPNSDVQTSLWFREKPNGIKVTNVPSKKTMEDELEKYIMNNVGVCVNSLSNFVDQGYSITLTKVPIADVTILDEEVDIILEYPTQIKYEDVEFLLENHLAKVDLNLGRLYNLATQLFEKQNADLFLERKTVEMLVAYDPEIPFSGVDLSCVEKMWNKQDVIKKLKEVISMNVGVMSVVGTRYENTNKYFNLNALSGSNSNIRSTFLYSKDWPTVVEVTPSDGEILRGDAISRETGNALTRTLSSFFCLSSHHFVYDIKYPVLISLTDTDKDFTFQFATEVIVDNNLPREGPKEVADEFSDVETPICDNKIKNMKVNTLTPSGGSFASLDDVEVYFKCFPAVCRIGKSKAGVLEENFPICFNGIVEGRKEGYWTGKALVSTNEDVENVNVILEPFYTKTIEVKVIEKETGEARSPYKSEQITFQFTHKPTGYSTNYVFPSEDNRIKLLVGDYEITSYVIGNSTWPITMAAYKIEKCVNVKAGGFLGLFTDQEKCFETEIPSSQMDYSLKGGAIFDYEFKREDLSNSNKIIIYTIAQPLPSNQQELSEVYASVEGNKDNQYFRYPEV